MMAVKLSRQTKTVIALGRKEAIRLQSDSVHAAHLHALSNEQSHQIINIYIYLKQLQSRIAVLGYQLKLTRKAKDFLSKQCYDQQLVYTH